MRKQRAILALAAVLAALLVAPSSAKVEPNAAEVNPKAGKWTGQTAQGFPIEFVVKKRPKGWKVVSASYEFTSECTRTKGGVPLSTTTVPGFLSWPQEGETDQYLGERGGTWAYAFDAYAEDYSGKYEQYRQIWGRFRSKTKAKGRFSELSEAESYAAGEQSRCKTGSVRWTAHR